MVGLELEECEIDENVGEMDVCLFVFTPELDCPILFPFEMNFYTTPGTAS